jgi:hypothetical protein
MGPKFVSTRTKRLLGPLLNQVTPGEIVIDYLMKTILILSSIYSFVLQVVIYRMCKLCAHLLTRWLSSSKMLLCVFVWVVPEISKNSDASSGKFQAVQDAGLPEPGSWRRNYLSKRREPLTQRQHGVTSQKTWNLSNTSVKISNLTFPSAIWKFRGEKVKQYNRILALDKSDWVRFRLRPIFPPRKK